MSLTFPEISSGELGELREAYCLELGLEADAQLPAEACADFKAWLAGYVLRRRFFQLTLTGEWVCLINDQLECRLQRTHLPVPSGWRVV